MDDLDDIVTTLASLTPHQRRIALLVADCFSNKEIAVAVGISPTTVKNHLTEIFLRSHTPGRMELAHWIWAQQAADADAAAPLPDEAYGVPILLGQPVLLVEPETVTDDQLREIRSRLHALAPVWYRGRRYAHVMAAYNAMLAVLRPLPFIPTLPPRT